MIKPPPMPALGDHEWIRIRDEQWQQIVRDAVAAEREACAMLCEYSVLVMHLPDEPRYEGDTRHHDRRVLLGVAAAIRARAKEQASTEGGA